MIRKMGIRWNLRRLMAGRDMFQTTDLAGPLAERGVHLSREQVFRLVTQPPQRLSMDTFAALCDILDCTPNDLIEVEAVNTQVRKAAQRPTDPDPSPGPVSRDRDDLRAQERQVRRTRILTVLTATLPGLAEQDAGAVLTSLRADRGIPLRVIDEHLGDHPDALTSGDTNCPAVVVRLVRGLRDAGHRGVVLPGCSTCGRTGVPLPRFGPGGRVCQACGVKNSKK